MPRDGSNNFALPAGTVGVSGTTANVTHVNSRFSDLETDMNTPRPVVAGGTGVSSVAAAQSAFKIPAFDGAATISGAWVHTGTETFNDNVALRLGTGADTTFLHNGTNTIITDASTGLIARTASFKVQNAAGTEDMIEAVQDSFVKLRFNNTTRLTTTVTGVDVTGNLEADSFSGAGVSTDIAADTGSTTKVPRVAAVEAYASKKLALATMVSASGATVDFTGIPAGTQEIIVMFNGVSLNGTNNILVQIGDAGGFETTGYVSGSSDSSAGVSSTAGFIVITAAAADLQYGKMSLNLMDQATFLWASTHGMGGNAAVGAGGGIKALSAELTQVRVTTSGANTFDAGTINIAYR